MRKLYALLSFLLVVSWLGVSSADAQTTYVPADYTARAVTSDYREISGTAVSDLGSVSYIWEQVSATEYTMPFNFLLCDLSTNKVKFDGYGSLVMGGSETWPDGVVWDYAGTYYGYRWTQQQTTYPQWGYGYYPNYVIDPWAGMNGSQGDAKFEYTVRGTAPNREFVYQSRNISEYDNSGAKGNYQVVLFEGGISTMQFNYQPLNNNAWDYANTTYYYWYVGFKTTANRYLSVDAKSVNGAGSVNFSTSSIYSNTQVRMPNASIRIFIAFPYNVVADKITNPTQQSIQPLDQPFTPQAVFRNESKNNLSNITVRYQIWRQGDAAPVYTNDKTLTGGQIPGIFQSTTVSFDPFTPTKYGLYFDTAYVVYTTPFESYVADNIVTNDFTVSPPNNIRAVGIVNPAPQTRTPVNISTPITLRFRNLGQNDQINVPLTAVIKDPDGKIVYRDTLYFPYMASTQTYDTVFKEFTFPKTGVYTVCAIAIMTNDQLRDDDTLCGKTDVRYENDVSGISIFNPQTDEEKPYTKVFKPTGVFQSVGVADLFDIPARVEIRRCSDGVLVFRADSVIPELNVDQGKIRFGFPTKQGTFDITKLTPGCYSQCVIARLSTDGDRRNDTSCTSFSIIDRLKGDIEVGRGRRFQTISAAVDSMRFRGIGGNLNLILTDAAYTESGNTTVSSPMAAIDFRGIEGTGQNAVVTIKPKPGVSPVITFNGPKPWCFYFGHGAPNYFTFDGNNQVQPTLDKLVAEPNKRGITIRNNSVNAGAVFACEYGTHHLTLKNLTLINNGKLTNDSSSVVRFYNEATKATFTNGVRDTLLLHDNRIENCFLGNARFGLFDVGLQPLFSAGPAKFFDRRNFNNTVVRNTIGSSAYPLGNAGIAFDNEDNLMIQRNQISWVNAGLSGDNTAYGIRQLNGITLPADPAVNGGWITISGNSINTAIDGNTIRNITGGVNGTYGVYFNQSTTVFGVGQASSTLPQQTKNRIANNAIYDLRGAVSYPVYLTTGAPSFLPKRDSIFNNSITTSNAAVNVFVQSGSPFIWNNIIQNTGMSGNAYTNYVLVVPRPFLNNISSDYNLFDLRGQYNFAQVREYVGGTFIQARTFRRLNDWRTYTEQDVHSVLGDPRFTSDSTQTAALPTLHLPGLLSYIASPAGNNGAWLSNAGQFRDIDGDSRQAGNLTPDIGADELETFQYGNDIAVTAIFKPAGYSATSDTTLVTMENPVMVQALVKNTGNLATFNRTVTATLEMALNGGSYQVQSTRQVTLNLDVNQSKIVDFNMGFNVTPQQMANGVFRVTVSADNDQNNSNNSQSKEFKALVKYNALLVSYESSTAKGRRNLDSVTAALRRLGVAYDSLDRTAFASVDVDYTPWWTLVWASGDPSVAVNGTGNAVSVGGVSFKSTEEIERFLNAGRNYAKKSLIMAGQNIAFYNDWSPINNSITDGEFMRQYLKTAYVGNMPTSTGYTGNITGRQIQFFIYPEFLSASTPDVVRRATGSPVVGDSVTGLAYSYNSHPLTPSDSAAGTTWHGPTTNVVFYAFDWADPSQTMPTESGLITSGTTRILRGALDFIQAFRGVALPVEFTSISAEALKTGNQITFSVSEEKDVHHYELEVLNANNTWQMVASEKAASQAASQKSYVMMDNQTATGSYTYRVVSVDLNGTRTMSQTVNVSRSAVAQSFSLEQNYPNPFNPSTTIRFTLAEDAKVTLRIMDVTGKVISTEIMGENMTQGNHSYDYKANGITSGTYVYELTAQSANGNITTLSKKMTLSK